MIYTWIALVYFQIEMAFLKCAVMFVMVAMVTAELGTSTHDVWAYQWYEDESFKFTYVHPESNDTSALYVEWASPNHGIITQSASNDALFEVMDSGNIVNGEITIKKVTSEVSGVYVCTVMLYNDRTVTVNRTIFGLNVHEQRYRSMSTKYNRNIALAFIVTAVFLVPLLTICLTYKFSYENRHPSSSHKNGVRSNMYSVDDYQMKGDVTDAVKSADGNGAYVNVGSTNM